MCNAESSSVISSESSFSNNCWFIQNLSEGKTGKAPSPKKFLPEFHYLLSHSWRPHNAIAKFRSAQHQYDYWLNTTFFQERSFSRRYSLIDNISYKFPLGGLNNDTCVKVKFFILLNFMAAILKANNFNCCSTKCQVWYSVHSGPGPPLQMHTMSLPHFLALQT